MADYVSIDQALDMAGIPRLDDDDLLVTIKLSTARKHRISQADYVKTPIHFPKPEEHVEAFLREVVPGFDPETNEHHGATAARHVKMMRELCEPEEFTFTTFPTTDDDMVVLGPIPFYTLCAHHVIPFHGSAFVGYVPDGRIAGLSKFARAVKYVAKGLWDQEGLTAAIAAFIEERLAPRGVAVAMEAEHLCMAMRGAETPGVVTSTAVMKGVFGDHSRTAKAEFLEWIRPRRRA